MIRLLDKQQVFDLSADRGPERGFDMEVSSDVVRLKLFQNVKNLRVLVCGGDGSVSWVLSTIDKLGLKELPPVKKECNSNELFRLEFYLWELEMISHERLAGEQDIREKIFLQFWTE